MFGSKVLPAALAASLLVGASGAALASEKHDRMSDRQEAATVLEANTSLAQAIGVAEREAGGKAMEASLEQSDGAAVYDIRVATAEGIDKVLVATDSGKVLKIAKVSKDRDDDGDEEDDD